MNGWSDILEWKQLGCGTNYCYPILHVGMKNIHGCADLYEYMNILRKDKYCNPKLIDKLEKIIEECIICKESREKIGL
jgi:hypothetical protein